MRCLYSSCFLLCFCGICFTSYWISEHTKKLALLSPSSSKANESKANESVYIQQRQIADHVVNNSVNNRANNIANNRANNSASKSANNIGPTGELYSNCSKSCPNCLAVQMPCNNCNLSATECKECIHPTPEICYRKFAERCSTSKHKVTKVLRMDTANARYLLQQHRNLKLIQIFRDPRGTVNSRHLSGWYYGGYFTILKDAEVLCNRIEKDLASAEYLMRLFPGRVKILQYEDFKDSFKVATSLYAFLDMGLTELTQSTKSLLLDPGTNHNFHPDSFRSYMSWNTIQSIQRTCYKVLERLGLRIFKDEIQFRNNTLDIVPGSLPYALEV